MELPLHASRNRTRRNRRVSIPDADARWHLLIPPRSRDEQDHEEEPKAFDFLVANKRLRPSSEAAGTHVAEKISVRWPARTIDWNVPTRIEWPSGERALLFEIEVRRPSRRQIRVRGENGVAWALFAPGADGGWRPRSSAAATGVAGGTTQIKFPKAGVWALVLFRDGRRLPGEAVEIS